MKSKINNIISTSLGAGLVVISSFFYASYGIWTKLMGDFFDGYTASALRSILVVLILVTIAAAYRKFEPLELKKNWTYIAGMIFASLFTWGPLYFAILEAGVGVSLAISYASIVMGMLFFGWLFSSEKITKDKGLSAILGIVGLILIFSPTNSEISMLALLAAVVSGLSAAANAVFAKAIYYSSVQSTIVLWIASIIANMFMAFILGKSYPSFSWQIEWFYLVIFAIVSVIASWSLVRGVKLIDAGVAGILGLVEIVFGIIFEVILFHERPTILILVGVGVILVSAAMPYISKLSVRSS